MPSVKAKVAEIIDDTLLALNAGSSKGVQVGSTVTVRRIVEIIDPETHEKLGSVSVAKLQLHVSHVQERLCIAAVTSNQDDSASNPLRVPRKKKIVTESSDEKRGISVFIEIGDPADIVVPKSPKEEDPWSDEPPF